MKLITIATAAKLLGLVPDSLRRRESADGKWTEVYGHRIRVYRIDLTPHAQRRFDEDEIHRVLARLQRAR
jgi:hypothetical protein